MYTWDTDRNEASNVSVNDGVVTYFAEWDTADDERSIDLQEVARDFASDYDHNNEPGRCSITVTNLITGEELEEEMIWEANDDDEDDDTDEDTDDDDEDGDADEDEDDDEEGEE